MAESCKQGAHARGQKGTGQTPSRKHGRGNKITSLLHPGKPPNPVATWDKTFRVTRIPKEFDSQRLSSAVEEFFKVKNISGFKIHSLASDAYDETEDPCAASTISFRTRPTQLQPTATEWEVDLPCTKIGQPRHVRVLFDTHFDGFTPLSSIENDHTHMIEYGFLNMKRMVADEF